ncbi:MAG: hypothetical protein IPG56_18205 [Caulobacteraceae bacterium]|nr:hypothetical protein [Caulobacteraceae bacterium]
MTGHNDDDDDEAVGYAKPPKKHQFKKGQSGCPSGGHKKRRLNKLERKEKEAEKLKERQKALEDIVQQVATEDQVVRTKRGPVKMANKEIVVRKIFQRAMRDDADDKDLRRCMALLDKVGMPKPTEKAPAGGGVLVIIRPCIGRMGKRRPRASCFLSIHSKASPVPKASSISLMRASVGRPDDDLD